MVEGLIGKKVGMTQTYDEMGNVIPVTVLKVGPCTVIQKKTKEKDGYAAVQLGLIEERELKNQNKPRTGHFKKADIPPVKVIREFRFHEKSDVREGSQFFVDMFEKGEKIDVIGTSKGKGFTGVIKRWGFHGGKDSHGSMFHRRPGSIGAAAYPSRVVKGKKMPGQMGNEQVTIKNLIVVDSDKEKNLLVVKGAVPGATRGYVLVKKADFQAILSGDLKPVKADKPVEKEQPEAPAESGAPAKPEPPEAAPQKDEPDKNGKDEKPEKDDEAGEVQDKPEGGPVIEKDSAEMTEPETEKKAEKPVGDQEKAEPEKKE